MIKHSSFNARNASPKQIAASFVVPDHFEQVAEFQNLVLVGPRGHGKTTIMKALTASGLYYLHQRPELKNRLSKIDFNYIPIYIPAETIWRGNAQSISSAVQEEGVKDHILNSLFVDHCLHQLICSFEDAVYVSKKYNNSQQYPWSINITNEDERSICNQCSEFWCIERVQHSFVGLKLALLQRSNKFRAAISSLPNTEIIDEIMTLPKLDFLIMLKGFFEIVGTINSSLRWSVCFDEMEIAPKRVLAQLYENLRSYDQRAVLKFSLFPYVDFYSLEQRASRRESGPVDGQDFHSVVLGNKFANPDFSLSRKLIEGECIASGVSYYEFRNYLNRSSAIHKNTRIFREDGFERNYSEILARAVQAGDRSYANYMRKHGVNGPGEIELVKGEQKRAQIIRKPAPIAEVRSYYFAKGKGIGNVDRRRASSKGFGYYHGFDQLLALTEGNPRAIKYYMRDLLKGFSEGEESAAVQNRAISRNVDRFRALISAQSYANDPLGRSLSVLEIVDRLGDALADNLLGADFQPEPALSYNVRGAKTQLKDALEIAINAGALVADQGPGNKELIFDMEGCRIRISHRLAPFYKLPTITGQPRILSNLPQANNYEPAQPDLLSWAKIDE